MPSGRKPDAAAVSEAERHAACIKAMSYRAARSQYRIGYATWRSIKAGKLTGWVPTRGGRSVAQETIDAVLESVKGAPEWNTLIRAQKLGIRTETVQKILTRLGLGRSPARLRFAGYQVDVVHPLAAARLRRILPSAPGTLTAIDFKAFGMVRGGGDSTQVKVCGCVVIDHFTGFGTVLLHPAEDAEAAAAGLRRHVARLPWPARGIILSDNGLAFLSNEYMETCADLGLAQRTTRYNHPWSNGKVEAFNRTLKQQCFPAICTGVVQDLKQLQVLLDVWLQYYNAERAHNGWLNKGLPPLVLYDRWLKAPGDDMSKLEHLGLVTPAELPFIRIMGTDKTGLKVLAAPAKDKRGLPPVFIIDHNPEEKGKRKSTFRPYRVDKSKSNVTLAK